MAIFNIQKMESIYLRTARFRIRYFQNCTVRQKNESLLEYRNRAYLYTIIREAIALYPFFENCADGGE